MAQQPWCADWRDLSEYPPAELHRRSTVWRWEFMRRHPDYPADMRRWNDAVQRDVDDYFATIPAPDPVAWRDPLQRKAIQQDLNERKRLRGDPLSTLRLELANKWGVHQNRMKWPEPGQPQGWNMFAGFAGLGMGILGPERFEELLRGWSADQIASNMGHVVNMGTATRVWLSFDISEHIGKQIEQAKKILDEMATEPSAKPATHRLRDPAVLLRMLRALDSSAASVPTAEVAATLFPHVANDYPDHAGNKEVRTTLKAARAMVASGFLRLRV
jgi:hypothetical protein